MSSFILHIIFGLLFSFHSLCHAQSYIYKNFGVDEGLPSSQVYDIYQDKYGYIWLATDKGIARYNGYEFENFTTKEGLPGNTVLDFYPQKNGDVWCYDLHSQSLFYFNEDFNGFKLYQYNSLLKGNLNDNFILKSLVIDAENTLHIGGYRINGIISINHEGKVSYAYQKQIKKIITYEKVGVKLGLNTKNNSFFSSYDDFFHDDDDVIILKHENNPFARMDVRKINDTSYVFIDSKIGLVFNKKTIRPTQFSKNPIGIKRVTDSTYFVGCYGDGAYIQHLNGKTLASFLPKKSVSNFLIDQEGGYWFTTLYNGVFYIKNPAIQTYSKDLISSLVKDDKNQLYLAFNNSDIAQLKNMKLEFLHKGQNNDPGKVEFDPLNKVVYGLSDYYKIINLNSKKAVTVPANNLPEQMGHPLFSSSSSDFTYLDKSQNINSVKKERTLDVAFFNDMILVADSKGLMQYENNSFKLFDSHKLLRNRIDDIDVHKNALYLATQGNGVVVYGDSIFNISKENGLTNDVIKEIHVENDSTLWACTHTGVNRIRFITDYDYEITTITKDDGLLSNDINDLEIINDTVWVATRKGLCFFNKSLLNQNKNQSIQSLLLKEVLVNNEVALNEKLKLAYDQNNIEFKLQAISLKNPKKINYKYRLKEIDTNWSVSSNRKISFPSLSPGNYTFEAKAEIQDIANSHTTHFNFTINPPFWRSWWFLISCLLFALGLIYLFFRIRVFTYNQDVTRELIRLIIKRLKRDEKYLDIRMNGEDLKVPTSDILYVKSSGNYLDIITAAKTYTIRCKIGDFIATTPDTLEYLRVHRSYIVRIDKITSKSKKTVRIKDEVIPVGETYLKELDKIQF
ncbi:MAG: LytTR family transcriptional regulator DNA-binding domain-containing protein [Flavobacteriaceae bacterium]|nr:LytTR family transcriptional regulator DNA-binding domain-containing protein [Flavobacteriaceae bacterium]